jgi:hypothetical protein
MGRCQLCRTTCPTIRVRRACIRAHRDAGRAIRVHPGASLCHRPRQNCCRPLTRGRWRHGARPVRPGPVPRPALPVSRSRRRFLASGPRGSQVQDLGGHRQTEMSQDNSVCTVATMSNANRGLSLGKSVPAPGKTFACCSLGCSLGCKSNLMPAAAAGYRRLGYCRVTRPARDDFPRGSPRTSHPSRVLTSGLRPRTSRLRLTLPVSRPAARPRSGRRHAAGYKRVRPAFRPPSSDRLPGGGGSDQRARPGAACTGCGPFSQDHRFTTPAPSAASQCPDTRCQYPDRAGD